MRESVGSIWVGAEWTEFVLSADDGVRVLVVWDDCCPRPFSIADYDDVSILEQYGARQVA